MKSGIHPSCGGSRWSKWRAAVDRNPLILLMRRFVRRLPAVVRGGCAKLLKSLVRRFCGGWGCGSPHTPLRLRAPLGRRASVMKSDFPVAKCLDLMSVKAVQKSISDVEINTFSRCSADISYAKPNALRPDR